MTDSKIYHFSAPGRTEICGNHTDHQHGCVIAAAVNLEVTADVCLNASDYINIDSEGYPKFSVDIRDLCAKEDEINTTAALIRGIAFAFQQRGAELKGFDAKIRSTVLPGSGLSSSAAFEVLIGTIMNHLFMDGKVDAVEVAKIGQWAENTYFGKPCGLMDETASAVGGMVYIDFNDPEKPIVEKLSFDFSGCGYALCIIDSGADHASLTHEYAAIPNEMRAVADFLGKEYLRDADENSFYEHLPEMRKVAGDRAVLRAAHFFDENRRVQEMKQALEAGNIQEFLNIVNVSGQSSWNLLQNITPVGQTENQDIALCLTIAKKLLGSEGAVRVHGGGFAGTIQAFVPVNMLSDFKAGMEKLLGEGQCHVLNIRNEGGVMR